MSTREKMSVQSIQDELAALGDPQVAEHSQRYFKAGPGEYGEGDRFRGIRVPGLRKLAQTHQATPLAEVESLLHSPFHEDRLLALLILVRQFGRADGEIQEKIYNLYVSNTHYINNWDLVDSSAEYIVGAYLVGRDHSPLTKLVRSPLLWERRIAILATFHSIKQNQFIDTFRIARMLLADREDLIHKAVGWMLREIGERNQEAEEAFLREHYRQMPRTMLRYAIEKFPEPQRQAYLKGLI
jgi:3-methyladenine DNA glycosylase AlkD